MSVQTTKVRQQQLDSNSSSNNSWTSTIQTTTVGQQLFKQQPLDNNSSNNNGWTVTIQS
jgi:hypothetical protein